LTVRATGAAVLALVFCVGWAAPTRRAQSGPTTTSAPLQRDPIAPARAEPVRLVQAGKPAKPPPNDVFTPVQSVGPWRIVKVYRDGKFHRCRAELGSVPNQLLIVKWASRNWGVAIANTRNLGPTTRHKMIMEIGRASEVIEGTVDVFGLYLAKSVQQGTIDAIRNASRFQLTSPMGTQTWNLSNTGSIAGGLEDCVNANIGNK